MCLLTSPNKIVVIMAVWCGDDWERSHVPDIFTPWEPELYWEVKMGQLQLSTRELGGPTPVNSQQQPASNQGWSARVYDADNFCK